MQRGLTLLRLIIRFLRLHSVDVLFVAKDASRPYEYRSRRYSPIFDTLREQFEASGARCLTISPPKSVLEGDAAHGDPVALGPFVQMFGGRTLAALLLPARLRREAENLSRGQRELLVTWCSILRRTRPAFVFAVYPKGALVVACRWLGIEIVDIQHGYFSAAIEDDRSYYGLRCPDETARPTVYWMWDERSAAEVSPRAEQIGASVVIGGNPWHERFASPNPDDALVADERARLATLMEGRPHPHVLVALSYSQRDGDDALDGLFLADSEIPLCVASAMQATSSDVSWLLRLHPVSLAASAATRSRAIAAAHPVTRTAIDASTVALPLLLNSIDGCLSIGSSVLLEARDAGAHVAFVKVGADPVLSDFGFTNDGAEVIEGTVEAVVE